LAQQSLQFLKIDTGQEERDEQNKEPFYIYCDENEERLKHDYLMTFAHSTLMEFILDGDAQEYEFFDLYESGFDEFKEEQFNLLEATQ